MAFSEQIKIVIDVAADKASASLKGFRQSIHDADGAIGKMKAGFGAAGGFIKANAVELAATAGAALVGFAAKAVGEFNNLALAAGKMGEALGISSEDASRWIEVAGDVGVEASAVEGAMLKMEKAAGANADAFREMGIDIAYAKDGSVDANETFVRTLERLKAIKDPTERAAVGTKLLGRNWAELAEILEGDVRGALASVSDAKIIDPEEVERARKFRDTWDELKGKLEDFTLAVGERAVPALVSFMDIAQQLGDVLSKLKAPWDTLRSAFSHGNDELVDLALNTYYAKQAAEAITTVYEDALDPTVSWWDATKKLTEQVAEEQVVMDVAKASIDSVIVSTAQAAEAARDHEQAVRDQVDAMRAAADAFFGAGAASDEYREFLQGLDAEIKDAKGDQEKLNAIYRDGVSKATALADANVQLAEDIATANGETLQGSERLDVFNQSMLDAAKQASGPLRQSILDYIGVANQIPAEKITEIMAIADAYGIEAAMVALNDVSAARTATITAEAETADAERRLRELAQDRFAKIWASVGQVGPASQPWKPTGVGAAGGIVTQPTMALIGESGPEALIPLDQMPGASPLPTRSSTTVNVYVSGSVVTERDLAMAIGEIWAQEQRRGATLPWGA